MKSSFPNRPDSRLRLHGRTLSIWALGLSCLAAPLSAEDPLLGRIRMIKCVGCNPGEVKLVVHDPIDVRDFEVRIKETDYQKIITPLAGKTIYDKGGCFYWMDFPKKPARLTGDPARNDSGSAGNPAGIETAETRTSAAVDSPAPDIAPENQEPEGTPSRCIPFERSQATSAGDRN